MAKTQYSGKTVVLLGLGKSTLALAKALHAQGAKIRLSELKPKEQFVEAEKELSALGVELEFGKNSPASFEGADYIVVASNPGIDTKPLEESRSRGVPIQNDVEFALSGVDKPVIAVVGSQGKTTAAVLVKAFLQASGKNVFYAGDAGQPLVEAWSQSPDYVILELSLAQIDGLHNFKPAAVVYLNLQPPFGDRVNRVEDAARILQNLGKQLNPQTVVVYNHKDNALRNILVPLQANKFVFRRKDPVQISPELAQRYRGAYLASARELVWLENGQKESFALGNLQMFGLHNRDNLMAALTLAKVLGVSSAVIQKTIDTFPGVEHRLELVKKRGGVRFVNDSRCTTVECMQTALESFGFDPIILIAGGKDNQLEFGVLSDLVKQRVKTMILVGEAKEHLNRCIGDYTETFLVGTFEEAILLSFQKSREGDIILLSPGCEGYDMFKSYEERGNYFKRYVADL